MLPNGQPAKRTRKINLLATAANMLARTTALDVVAPDPGIDAAALSAWIAAKPEPSRYLEALPEGPPEPRVPEDLIAAGESFIEGAADAAGLFFDESGDE